MSAPGWTTAHLARDPDADRPMTACGRILPRGKEREADEAAARCHYCTQPDTPTARKNERRTSELFARGARLRAGRRNVA